MTDKHADDCNRAKFTLDQPITYQIEVAGQLSENWSDWMEMIDVRIVDQSDGPPYTTLTGPVDQAALNSLLRRLYYLGYPLISVNCIQPNEEEIIRGLLKD